MFPALLGDTNWQQMTQMTWNVTFETKCDINVIDVIPWSTIVLRGQRSPAGHARPLGGVEAAAPKCLPPLPPVCPPHVKNHMKMFQNNQQNKFTAIFCVKKNLEQMRPTPSDTVCAWVCVGFGLDALMHGIPSDICVWCSDPESPKTSGRSKLSPSSCNQHPPLPHVAQQIQTSDAQTICGKHSTKTIAIHSSTWSFCEKNGMFRF